MTSLDPIAYFSQFIQKELGIVYSEFNRFQLQNRLEEVSRIVGAADPVALQKMAMEKMTPDLKQLILDIATNNETSFFRDPKLFKAVEDSALHSIAGANGANFRIWSAACSNGQEPYSLAMILDQIKDKSSLSTAPKILATDISSRVLEKAAKGRYSQLEIQRGLPAPLLIKYFKKDDENFWTVSPALKAMVEFRKLNLLDSFSSLGQFDVIFCRNVLIYQNVENKIRILDKLTECLKPGGYLVLGAGESLIGLSENFETVKSNESIFYRLKKVSQKLAA